MASQLISHTRQRVLHCADQLAHDGRARDAGQPAPLADAAMLQPGPVTQDEMDAGSVELF